MAGRSFEVIEGSKVIDSGDPESKDRGIRCVLGLMWIGHGQWNVSCVGGVH